MGNGWAGLSSGLDRGLRLGMALEGNKERKEDRARRIGREETMFGQQQEDRERRIVREDIAIGERGEDRDRKKAMDDMTKQLTQMQITTMKDNKKRKKLSDDNNAVLYSLYQIQTNPEEYMKQIQGDPEAAKKLEENVGAVAEFAYGDTGEAGEIKGGKLIHSGGDEANPTFHLQVETGKDGKKTLITENRKSLEGGDTPKEFTIQELSENAAALKAFLEDNEQKIQEVERKQVASGDMGPLNRMRAAKVAKSTAASKRKIAEQKHQDAKELAMIKKTDPSVKDRLVDIGTDPMTGEKRWARYDLQTKQLVPVAEEQSGLASLPLEQQRPAAIQMMQEAGIKPEESNLAGFGDDTYSDDQINAFIGRESIGQASGSSSETPRSIGKPTGQPSQEDIIQSVLSTNSLPDTKQNRDQIIQAALLDPRLKPLFSDTGTKSGIKKSDSETPGTRIGQYKYEPKVKREEPRKVEKGGALDGAIKSIDKFSKAIDSGEEVQSLQVIKRLTKQIKMLKRNNPTASEKAQIKIIEKYLNAKS